nr:hypothetical protein [Desulfobulbaceae bacterium]
MLNNRYNPDLYYNSLYDAKLKLRKGNKSEALASFQEASAYNSKRSTPYYYIGQILEEFGQYDMALKKAVDVSPANTDRAIKLGKCFYELGNMKESKKYLLNASAMVQDSYDNHA